MKNLILCSVLFSCACAAPSSDPSESVNAQVQQARSYNVTLAGKVESVTSTDTNECHKNADCAVGTCWWDWAATGSQPHTGNNVCAVKGSGTMCGCNYDSDCLTGFCAHEECNDPGFSAAQRQACIDQEIADGLVSVGKGCCR